MPSSDQAGWFCTPTKIETVQFFNVLYALYVRHYDSLGFSVTCKTAWMPGVSTSSRRLLWEYSEKLTRTAQTVETLCIFLWSKLCCSFDALRPSKSEKITGFYDVLIGCLVILGQHLLWSYVTPATWNTWLLILANILCLLHWHALARIIVDPSTIHQSSVRPSVHPSIHLSILRSSMNLIQRFIASSLHLVSSFSFPFVLFWSLCFAWCVLSIHPSFHRVTNEHPSARLPTFKPIHLPTSVPIKLDPFALVHPPNV